MSRRRRDHGHHGGAWKVAYADFVTAMMALFIVLWILGTKEETKAAVASYFRHPSVFKSGGSGFLTGEGMREYQQAVARIRAESGEAESGILPPPGRTPPREDPIAPEEMAERGVLVRSAHELERAVQGSSQLRPLSDQVSVDFASHGMRVQLQDLEALPLFELDSPEPTGVARELLTAVARVLAPLPNPILVEGHTDSRPYGGQRGYSNWELSGDRANAARRVLEESGIDPRRIASVIGYADRHPLVPDDPHSQSNRRISIIVGYEGAARPE
ncbi:MAG: OmpA family protein [Candidatus Eisenbacteria bacterium]|uniref:OmpA family protein n=1 Tax=Eiseniibacteriota bacterium TaxID=2212470 RepID=A0A938BN18_UNCEI|nr:OmpA family protein [Candidatus Eisenbacteria bacterium]